jgi:hypothetical protein
MGARPEDSCREYFKTLQILPLASQRILSVALFMIHNKDLFKINLELHKLNTRGNSYFFQPMTNLKMCHRDLYYSGINVHNLPLEIRRLSDNVKLFKEVLKKFLLKQTFYTLGGYFSYKTNRF